MLYADGIFRCRDRFSMCFTFSDINYAIASKDDQTKMFLAYCELINTLDASATAKITLLNRRVNRSDFEESMLIPERYDDLVEPSIPRRCSRMPAFAMAETSSPRT